MESKLIISFKDQSPSYTYGFEAGIIYAMCESGCENFTKTIHKSNMDVVKDICKHYDYKFVLKQYRDLEYADIIGIKNTISDN